MIKILGIRRIMVLVFLVSLNAALAAGTYMYMMPEKLRKQGDLSTLRSKNSSVQSDIERMQVEFDQLEAQQAHFSKLKEQGFFTNQGRREAEKILELIQRQAGVISAIASVQPGKLEPNEEAQKSEHDLLVSPVQINIDAVDDVDVFKYIYLLQRFFPGHVTFSNIEIKRNADVSGTVLRGIATGQNPQIVEAKIDLQWRTMIPSSAVINPPTGGAP